MVSNLINTKTIFKVLYIGDIFGKAGRSIIKDKLQELREKYLIDLVIANAENAAHGKGVSPKIIKHLMESGVDFFSLGNHAWAGKKEDLEEIFNTFENIIRPLNLKSSFQYYNLGRGTRLIEGSRLIDQKKISVRVTNLIGNSVHFRSNQSNCFKEFKTLLESIENSGEKSIHIVDLHAETTSEKNAFLWAFNGRVSAIVGTHTHVPTNDALITEEGTAYLTDIGMSGPSTGVIGGKRDDIIQKFFDPESRFKLEPQLGPRQFCSVLITFDQENYLPIDIQPIIIREGFKVDKANSLI